MNLKETMKYSNGYTCEFLDTDTGEIYSGYDKHSPIVARNLAIQDFKDKNPHWDKEIKK